EKVKNPVPDTVVSRFIHDISSFERWTVVGYDAQTIMEALKIQKKFSLHFWDALLAATMKQNHLDTIYTEDSHFKKISWISVVNPFLE
ncbi:MAG: PIN domain-containing protein, partial [Methanomicrobiales archaeon]|nr:PIN domain-containing protein [Methanomicrobiales archaeon]